MKNLRKQVTIPNILTTLRLIAIPFMVQFILQKTDMLLAFLFFLAIWFTDMADGYIARKYNQISELGKVYDPLVDKLFQLSTAISMYVVGRMPIWVPLFIFIKESMMILGSLILWNKKTVVQSQWFGKLATALYVIAFSSAFFINEDYSWLLHILFLIPCFFSVLALVLYAVYYSEPLKEKEESIVQNAKTIKNGLQDVHKVRQQKKCSKRRKMNEKI